MAKVLQSVVAVLVAATFGCALPTDWSNPGTIPRQRFRAMLHDPYSDVDIGPDVVGGRPRDFQKPIPQAVRNQPYPLNVVQAAPVRLY